MPHEPATVPNDGLRDELLAMLAKDQAARADETSDMTAVDRANTARMKQILQEHGWPGWSLVGEKGSTAAWALVQHADLDLAFQEVALAHLQGAVDAKDASPGDLAYLIDRVRVAKGQPQLYGTQISMGADGKIAPRTPIEDEAGVDARRAAAGLGTLADYYAEFGAPEPSSTP